jgi:LmbE family N-acetylglucosaminyl deacetylase
MLRPEAVRRAVILAPHADDEAMGCAGLMARLAEAGAELHVLYVAVDGFHHYGIERETTFRERVEEIDHVLALFGDRCSYEVAYGGQDMIERLDTLPRRELVDRFEQLLDERRPDLLLIPSGRDYDQDHVAVFEAVHAAARPIAQQFGKWLVPHMLAYEMTKIQWAAQPLPRAAAFCDITGVLDVKLEAIRRYATQARPSPHIRSPESVRALATIRGAEIGVESAEAFEVLRTVL